MFVVVPVENKTSKLGFSQGESWHSLGETVKKHPNDSI